ncbi:hypothetical protein AB1N83_003784 [Pleurotus pulmonarius]
MQFCPMTAPWDSVYCSQSSKLHELLPEQIHSYHGSCKVSVRLPVTTEGICGSKTVIWSFARRALNSSIGIHVNRRHPVPYRAPSHAYMSLPCTLPNRCVTASQKYHRPASHQDLDMGAVLATDVDRISLAAASSLQ